MERHPFEASLILLKSKGWDTGKASVLFTRPAVLLLLVGFHWLSSFCLPSVLQCYLGSSEGKLKTLCCNARVNGIDPFLKPHSRFSFPLVTSLQLSTSNPLLYICFIS